jgi:hypothetical protein
MVAIVSRVRNAVLQYNGSSTLRTKQITAPNVRPLANFWPTELFRGCFGMTGLVQLKHWKPGKEGFSYQATLRSGGVVVSIKKSMPLKSKKDEFGQQRTSPPLMIRLGGLMYVVHS